ncbi:hypothetical protein Unana1_02848 [Umbelopsis nana]
MIYVIAIVVVHFICAVSTQNIPVTITAPLTDTVFTAGGLAQISWTEARIPTISQIQLVKGSGNNLRYISLVATDVNTTDGKFAWVIPADTPDGSDYAFELGSSPNLKHTGNFAIKVFTGCSAFLNATYGDPIAEPGKAKTNGTAKSASFAFRPRIVDVCFAAAAAVLLA